MGNDAWHRTYLNVAPLRAPLRLALGSTGPGPTRRLAP